MLEQYFAQLERQYIDWLYEVVESELKDVELADFLASESTD